MGSRSEAAAEVLRLAAEKRWDAILASHAADALVAEALNSGDVQLAAELSAAIGRASSAGGDSARKAGALQLVELSLAAAGEGPRDPRSWMDAATVGAILMLDLGRAEDAAKLLESILLEQEREAVPRPRELSATHARLAHVYAFVLQRPAEAVPHYRHLNDAEVGAPEPMRRMRKYVLGYCLAHAGASSEALELVGEALQGAPSASPWHDELTALVDAISTGKKLPIWKTPGC
jgi:hypothetical protein